MPGFPEHLTESDIEQLGKELDALRDSVIAQLGEADKRYIYNVIKAQRSLEIAGRTLLFMGFFPPAWLAGTVALSLSKILDNMEIGHNVMHGQFDWMRDPALNSKMFEWDTVCPSENWRHSHNYIHHTFTNVLDEDRDIGYGILRMDEAQRWHPYYLGNPVYAFLLMVLFQWGVAVHDLEVERLVSGERTWAQTAPVRKRIWKKVGKQALKDYVLFPLLTGPSAPLTFAGNVTANLVRNVWAFSIIFCGHFPEGVASFSKEQIENETKGGWYLRQMLGSANITGSRMFHLLSGNLSHQIEHHLFPDIPARRYAEMAPHVREICRRYGLPYNTGSLGTQLRSVFGKIARLALPGPYPQPVKPLTPTVDVSAA